MLFALGTSISLSTVWRALDREGITHMQVTFLCAFTIKLIS
ncbi:hypothetical protein CcCBS67573_g10319 [Chytriomyces confervae]|uniref:Uncharacterized protein n=1 Tax=Chytriomyces confervae TaxID=246404 RepID=A0A507D4X0_9FUNG|nr:hypothetical protein CcCBS67573_g10319 [Chytriomyces confervae]